MTDVVNIDWEPIETAPKDRQILLFCPGEKGAQQHVGGWAQQLVTGKEAWRFAAYWKDGEGLVCLLCNPTHWQELPAPPA